MRQISTYVAVLMRRISTYVTALMRRIGTYVAAPGGNGVQEILTAMSSRGTAVTAGRRAARCPFSESQRLRLRVMAAAGASAGMNTPGPSSLGGTGPSGPAARGLFGRSLLYVVVLSLQTVAAVVVSPMLAYLLGPTEFGSLATAIALHQALIVLAVLGLDQGLVLQRAADKDSRAARGLVAVGIALSMAVTLGIGVTGPLWSRPLGFGGFSSLLIATVLWTAPGAIVQLTLAELLTEDRLVPFAAVSVLSAVGGQVFGIALLFSVARTASAYAWPGVA